MSDPERLAEHARGRMRPKREALRAALVQSAWAASHTKTYLAAPYRRLAKRRRKKKALVAVGHSLLGIIFQVLTKRQAYRELGGRLPG